MRERSDRQRRTSPLARGIELLTLTVPSLRARREHTHNNTLTMGLGRKANKGDTSATSTSSDESSWMPSQVAADLSNTALEVRSRPGQVASQQAS